MYLLNKIALEVEREFGDNLQFSLETRYTSCFKRVHCTITYVSDDLDDTQESLKSKILDNINSTLIRCADITYSSYPTISMPNWRK